MPDPDLTQLPFDSYHQLVHTLCALLPPPVADTPEALARRNRAAIAQVAALVPANAEEANLGAQYVAAGAHAMDCLRLIRVHADDIGLTLKLTAQSASMMRQARGYRSLLLRVQSAREKREANPATRDSAAWTEHCVLGLMAEALSLSASEPAAEPPVPEVAPPPPRRAVPTLAETDDPQPDPAAEAETYALHYPRRARLIRRLGGLPSDCDFGPPEPELVY